MSPAGAKVTRDGKLLAEPAPRRASPGECGHPQSDPQFVRKQVLTDATFSGDRASIALSQLRRAQSSGGRPGPIARARSTVSATARPGGPDRDSVDRDLLGAPLPLPGLRGRLHGGPGDGSSPPPLLGLCNRARLGSLGARAADGCRRALGGQPLERDRRGLLRRLEQSAALGSRGASRSSLRGRAPESGRLLAPSGRGPRRQYARGLCRFNGRASLVPGLPRRAGSMKAISVDAPLKLGPPDKVSAADSQPRR